MTDILLHGVLTYQVQFVEAFEQDEIIGRCSCVGATATIVYRIGWLTKELVAHECAHALALGAGHGKIFRQQMRENLHILEGI